MKPVIHASHSVRKYGGVIEDYIAIHEFIDSSKAHVPDMRHRAILHSSFGIYITQQLFGTHFNNSGGRLIAVRDIAEEHVLQDLGTIPTVQDYLSGMPFYDWLGGTKETKSEFIPMDGIDQRVFDSARKMVD